MLNDFIIKLEVLGKDEEPIFIHKFRTMSQGADADFLFLAENGLDSLGKIINDSRITPLGKIMRKYFIDELPQLYDLNRGVISLIGVRPKSREYWRMYPEEHMKRSLRYKPGLFGVHYYYTNLRDFKDGIQAEIEYLDRREKEDINRLHQEYFRVILYNIIFKGLRSK